MAEVTVAIPVYNGARFIARAIESVLTQTYPKFILKIIDNASTDLTPDIVKSFKDKRIRYVRNKKNIGMLGNWKKCLDADTKYVAILFADDFYRPTFLEESIKQFKGNVGIVASGTCVATETGAIKSECPLHKNGLFSDREYYKYIYGDGMCPVPSVTVLLTEAVKAVGGFDTKHLNWLVDGDLYLRICTRGFAAYHLTSCLSCRRGWSGNTTNTLTYSMGHYLDRYYILRKYYRKDWITQDALKSAYKGIWRMGLGSILYNARRGRVSLAAQQLALLICEGDRPHHGGSLQYRIASVLRLGLYFIEIIPSKIAGE